jgi:hypothetical protein
MEWTMLYLFLALKLPIAGLAYIVWWAVRDAPEPVDEPGEDDGPRRRRHPRPPLPRSPRRGPHGGGVSAAPPRVRPLRVRGRARSRAS